MNKQFIRRTVVTGVLPNPAALQRFARAVLIETYDEWQVTNRSCLTEVSMAHITTPATETTKEVPLPKLIAS